MFRRLIGLSLALITLAGTAGTVQAHEVIRQDMVLGAINVILPGVSKREADMDRMARLRGPALLQDGDLVVTDANGVALITWFYDGTETVLGSRSRLTVHEMSGGVSSDFVIDLELHSGHLVSGLGSITGLNEDNVWHLATPAYDVRLLGGQIEVRVSGSGQTTLIVLEGAAEVWQDDAGQAVRIEANEYLTGAAGEALGEPETLSEDGVTVSWADACIATAATNLNIRLAPSETSRRLGGVTTGQELWVRASTEGNLWLLVYFRAPETEREAHNFGWVYRPTTQLDDARCDPILRAALDAQLYGGPGIARTSDSG